jgi:hypothetical protein
LTCVGLLLWLLADVWRALGASAMLFASGHVLVSAAQAAAILIEEIRHDP